MSKEVINQQPEQKPQTIIEKLKSDKFKERIQQALGKAGDIDSFLSNTILEISKSPKLMNCSFESIMQCAIDCANFGLIPNKQLGHIWLIPYENSYKENGQWIKRLECSVQIGYKGYIKKFAEYGMNVEVEIATLTEYDLGMFQEIRGSNPQIIHRPVRTKLRDDIYCAYAIGRQEGRKDLMVVLGLADIEEIVISDMWDDKAGRKIKQLRGVWASADRKTDKGEMCKKTAIRRLAKISDIEIVNKMNDYEGEKEAQLLKNVTPQNNKKPEFIPLNINQEDFNNEIDKKINQINDVFSETFKVCASNSEGNAGLVPKKIVL